MLRHRQDNTDEEIKLLKQEIANLKVRDKELLEHIDAVNSDQDLKRRVMAEEQNAANTGFLN